MYLDIEFDELEKYIHHFYNHVPDVPIEVGHKLRVYDQERFKRLQKDYFGELGLVPEKYHERFNLSKKEEYKKELGAEPFVYWCHNVPTIPKGTTEIRYEDFSYECPRTQLSFELEQVKATRMGDNDPWDAIRYYYILWRFYRWFEDFAGIKEIEESQRVEFIKRTPEYNTSLNRESLFLLFWHLKEAKVIHPAVKNQTINTCFQALTGITAKQANKVIHKREIESAIRNQTSFDGLEVALKTILRKLQVQKENITP